MTGLGGPVANLICNIMKGKFAYYCGLPAANDGLIIVPLESSGLEADATFRDYDDLASLLAGTTNEQTTVGRKTVSTATVTVDDTNDRTDITWAEQTWTAPSGNAIGAILVCYDPDTTTGTDSTVVPIAKWDVTWTPDGNDTTTSGWNTLALRAA